MNIENIFFGNFIAGQCNNCEISWNKKGENVYWNVPKNI